MSDQSHFSSELADAGDRNNLAVFRLDYQRLVHMLLPFSLRNYEMHLPLKDRKHTLLSWLHALLSPVKRLYMEFLIYRNRVNYQMDHTGQVVYLEKVLNDRFDPAQERIRIKDGPKRDRNYIYCRNEKKPKPLGKIHLYNRPSYGDQGVDFEVCIPVDSPIWVEDNLWVASHSIIDYYKLAGKTYQFIKP